jgi:hypothetical protein
MATKFCRECAAQVNDDLAKCPTCEKEIITPTSFSFWCFLSMCGGLCTGAMLMFIMMKMSLL